MAFLQIRSGPRAGERVSLTKEKVVIGRHPACDIVLDTSAVSRQHATIVLETDTYFLEDLSSRNGTTLNGVRVDAKKRLEDGDEVQICEQSLIFTTGTTPSEEAYVIGSETSNPDDFIDSAIDGSRIMSQVDVPAVASEAAMALNTEAKLRAVINLNKALGGSVSLEEVLPKLLDGIFEMFPKADRGFVLLRDMKSKRLILRSKKLRSVPEPGPIRLSVSLLQQVVLTKRGILSADAASDSQFGANNESMIDCRIRSLLCVPLVRSDDVVTGVIHVDTLDLRDSFDAKDLEVLAGIAGMASRVVEQARTYEERIGQEQVNRDLDLAKRVQQGLLPSKPPDVTGYQLFDFYEPAREIGGDFFDYIPLSGGRLAIVLADVSGKGVSAALVMMALSKDVRYCLASEEDLSTAVARINESFCKGGWDDRFATAIFLVLDPIAHKAKLVSAGHMPAYVRTPDGRLETHGDDTAGTPLGVVSQAVYESIDIALPAGSVVVLYTDGISEAMDQDQRPYGMERLEKMCLAPADSAEETGRRILKDVERYTAGQIRSDDICLVCLGRT